MAIWTQGCRSVQQVFSSVSHLSSLPRWHSLYPFFCIVLGPWRRWIDVMCVPRHCTVPPSLRYEKVLGLQLLSLQLLMPTSMRDITRPTATLNCGQTIIIQKLFWWAHHVHLVRQEREISPRNYDFPSHGLVTVFTVAGVDFFPCRRPEI